MEFRKPPSAIEVRDWLEHGQLAVSPLRFRLLASEPRYSPESRWDFEVEARWGKSVGRFAVEYKSLSTPKAFDEAVRKCLAVKLPKGWSPLLLMPYLKEAQLEELENVGCSGVDWCGNGVVFLERFRVFRAGGQNRFTTYAPIKNIYRKNTSMVSRALLAVGKASSVGQIREEVNDRNLLARSLRQPPMSLGTVSKALAGLEDDLIVARSQWIRLVQPEKLLDRLQQSYQPQACKSVRLKIDCRFDQLPQRVAATLGQSAGPIMATGLSSVFRYATMQRGEILSLYCPRIDRVRGALEGRENDRFANVELIESTEQSNYFDAKQEHGLYWASPVQSYIELMRGDKRDRETADQVKQIIMNREDTSAQ
jgi:hypothetical protein